MSKGEDLEFEINFCESLLSGDKNDTEVLTMLAHLYTDAGRIEEGLNLDRRLVELEPDNALNHYNLACSLTLLEQFEEAFSRLRTAVDRGYRDFRWMLQDPDLAGLRERPEFESFLRECRNKG